MDYLRVQGISCEARLGVSRKERRELQFIRVDLSAGLDMEAAANTDDLELTVDYAQLIRRVQKTVRDHECYLLESLAQHLCRSVLTDSRIREVTVQVYKFPENLRDEIDQVSIEMTRRSG